MEQRPTDPGDVRHQERPGTAQPIDPCVTAVHIGRWKAGDPAAFETLHHRFAPLLRARVRRSRVFPMLEGQMQADDVVQEIWARAVPAAERGFTDEGPGSFLAFLAKIADRTMVDLARTLRAAKRGGHDPARALQTGWERRAIPRPGLAAAETPTSHARASELTRMAEDELNERELEAWELVELQGFNADEAGLAMDCSGAAVRGLLLRSRAKLVARMGHDGRD